MTIAEEIQNGIAVLTINGSLLNGPDAMPFHTHIKRLAEKGINKVVVDFSNVRWFSSAMLGVLTASLTALRRAGGDLRLAGVNQRINSLFETTQLSDSFRTAETVEHAVTSFIIHPPTPADRAVAVA